MSAEGIRSYGPGKFHNVIDEYVYEIVMNGFGDDSLSYEDAGGGYDLVTFDKGTADTIRKFAEENDDELTEEEEDLIEETAAVILFTRSDGIIEATWFKSEQKAERTWAKLEEEFAGEEDEGDEEQFDDEGDEDDDDVFSSEEMTEGYVISDARGGGVNVVHEHKHVGHYDDIDEALEAIEGHMKRSNFFPNIYYVNERGNIDLLDSEGNSIKSRV